MPEQTTSLANIEASDSQILRAASSDSNDWDDETWAAWFRTAERVHGDGVKRTPLFDKVGAQQARIAELEAKNAELDRALDEVMTERDGMHDALDKFALAVAPEDVIGEHSSGNNPWANALDLLTPMAEVDKLRADNAELERALGLNEAAVA
ncbi:hypothetical protein [Streptomyces sp. ok210]|uniref:hypothetical protein n=1 Tax=Streptomyces sp. ok210 TaxID=1761905 RepID=UPI0008E5519B|nr:hypothetical protein [Streptomyces sp. ok210]SFT31870.1 hypothetical protein SAMN04487982_12486 [Streptomyces sp. ok210]